jgi:hypothetical protein
LLLVARIGLEVSPLGSFYPFESVTKKTAVFVCWYFQSVTPKKTANNKPTYRSLSNRYDIYIVLENGFVEIKKVLNTRHRNRCQGNFVKEIKKRLK